MGWIVYGSRMENGLVQIQAEATDAHCKFKLGGVSLSQLPDINCNPPPPQAASVSTWKELQRISKLDPLVRARSRPKDGRM